MDYDLDLPQTQPLKKKNIYIYLIGYSSVNNVVKINATFIPSPKNRLSSPHISIKNYLQFKP